MLKPKVIGEVEVLIHAIIVRSYAAVCDQRCREHKKRNVSDALPERLRASVRSAMSQVYASRDPKRAARLLENLARRLEADHPGAAASVR
jgi:transposase-like protein